MKQILLILLCHFVFNVFSQNSNTFFVTKISESSNVKLVLCVGDKMTVKYTDNSGPKKVKGKINDIRNTYIIIDSFRIELNEIDLVSKHKKEIKIFGGILFASGTALIVAGIKRSENPIEIVKQTPGLSSSGLLSGTTKTIVRDGSTMIGLGSIICGISSLGILIPRIYPASKYRYSTYVN